MTDFSAIMQPFSVNAILREIKAPGTGKTNTRRLAWQTDKYDEIKFRSCGCGSSCIEPVPSRWQHMKPGDRIWVREALVERNNAWCYEADGAQIELQASDPRVSQMIGWAHHQEKDRCSARHMPKWASRLTLIVTVARLERLQDIGKKEAIAEGIERIDDPRGIAWRSYETYPDGTSHPHALAPNQNPVTSFKELWSSLHGRNAWNANPEVVAIAFKPILQNVVTMTEAQAA